MLEIEVLLREVISVGILSKNIANNVFVISFPFPPIPTAASQGVLLLDELNTIIFQSDYSTFSALKADYTLLLVLPPSPSLAFTKYFI